jgi:hypothetical protein
MMYSSNKPPWILEIYKMLSNLLCSLLKSACQTTDVPWRNQHSSKSLKAPRNTDYRLPHPQIHRSYLSLKFIAVMKQTG